MMTRSDLDDYRARVSDAARQSEATPGDPATREVTAELAELAQHLLAELERTRYALGLSRSRYAELADVALATLAALAHDEADPGAHLEHTLQAHGHAPRLAEALPALQVLADPATWRRCLEVA